MHFCPSIRYYVQLFAKELKLQHVKVSRYMIIRPKQGEPAQNACGTRNERSQLSVTYTHQRNRAPDCLLMMRLYTLAFQGGTDTVWLGWRMNGTPRDGLTLILLRSRHDIIRLLMGHAELLVLILALLNWLCYRFAQSKAATGDDVIDGG